MPSAGRRESYRFDSGVGGFRHQFDGAMAAHDPVRAAALLETHCEALFADSEARVFATCVSQIPRSVRNAHPRTMLALAWRLTSEWRFEEADDLLSAVRGRISRTQASQAPHDLTELRLLLRHGEAMLAQVRDDMPQAEAGCRRLIEEFPAASPYVRGSLFTGVLHALREQYKLGEIDRYDALARDCIQQSSNDHALAVHESVAGSTFFMVGRCDGAISALRSGLELVTGLCGAGHPLGALTALPLAEVLYERNVLEEAAALTALYLPVANELGFVDQLVSGYLTQARLCRRRGDMDEALAVLERASIAAARRGFRRLGAWAIAERVKLLAECGRPRALKQAIREAGGRVEPLRMSGTANVTTEKEARALAWVRVARAQCRVADALRVARSWRALALRTGAVRSLIRWEVLLATLLLLDGQGRAAMRALGRAATAAAPGRFFASFLDEGSVVQRLLAEQPDGFAVFGETTRAFVARLMPMFGTSGVCRPVGGADALPVSTAALSPKEIEVLALAARGWRNQDIGSRLSMSEATVKWYLHQCYEKLGVTKRAFAADKARRFGLID